MAKRKNKKEAAQKPVANFKNQAFKALKELPLAEEIAEEQNAEHEDTKPVSGTRAELDRLSETSEDEDDLFRRAIQGATALKDRPRAPRQTVPELVQVDEDAEAALQMAQLVDGRLPFDITYTDEFVEGHVQGVDRSTVKRLKRGEYAIQAVLDLHGYIKVEARDMVERFIRDSRVGGLRCVLIVHGRGLNSKDQVPVLKESLRSWFERGRGAIGGSVLAFTSARPVDGGLGAMYVLLRKQKAKP